MPVTQEFETKYLSDLDDAIRRYKQQADDRGGPDTDARPGIGEMHRPA
jgi:hypothetical protein